MNDIPRTRLELKYWVFIKAIDNTLKQNQHGVSPEGFEKIVKHANEMANSVDIPGPGDPVRD